MPREYEFHDELTSSLRTHAVESTTDPGADLEEFGEFDAPLRDVDVVGMGEATHRTREFARFKHRLFRYLVTERGFRLFGLEAPFSETMALHDYVVHGTGDLESALERIDFRIYRTEELVALFEWMRAFNEDRPPADRIAVYGFDIQSAAGAAAALREVPRDTAVDFDEDRHRTLETLSDGVFEGEDVDVERLRTAEKLVSELEAQFEFAFGSRPDADPRSPGIDPALATQHLRTLRRACEFARTGMEADRTAQWGFRDRSMAAGVTWIREYDPFDRLAIWAHDNHVKRGTLSGDGAPSETMGEHLVRRYGRRYYALGAQFGRGTVRALVPTESGEFEWDGLELTWDEVPTPEPVAGSVPDAFDRLETPVVLVDYRSIPEESRLYGWLNDARPHRYVAGIVDPDDDSSFHRDHNSIAAFDGLVFVQEVTTTTPL